MKQINLTHVQAFFTVLLLLVFTPADAQRWYQVYPTNGMYDESFDVDQTPDGGFIMAGTNGTSSQHGHMIKTDPNGVEQWRYENAVNIQGMQVVRTPDNGYMLFGGGFELGYSKVDASGNFLWDRSYTIPGTAGCMVYDAIVLPDSGLILSGGMDYMIPAENHNVFLARIDKNGDTLWTRQYDWGTYDKAFGIRSAGSGEYFVMVQPGTGNGMMMRIDANGDSLGVRPLSGVIYSAESVQHTSDGGFVAATIVYGPAPAIITVDKLDAAGNIQWTQTYPPPSVGHYAFSIAESPAGGYMMTGVQGVSGGSYDYKLILIRIDNSGNFISKREYDFAHYLWGNDIIAANGGGFAISGRYSQYTTQGQNTQVILMRVDDNGLLFSNLVNGNVYSDLNDNCTYDSGEQHKQNWIVTLAGTSGTHSATTDAAGNYEIWADSGNYTLSITNASIYWDASTCSFNSTPVVLVADTSTAYDTTTVDFPRKALVSCPVLDVDISTPLLRRCFNNIYYVNYCNIGTDDAQNAVIEVVMDSLMSYVSSSIPVASQNGDTLHFNLGTVPEGDCGSFNITVYLSCNSLLGQTHCISAYSLPDTLCLPPNPNWDLASVHVEGNCIGNDSVQFKIKNRGVGNMAGTENYYITEENIMMFTSPFQLISHDSIVLYVPANGSTWRLQAGQSDFHPWNDSPVAVTVEGCGTNSQGTFTVGLFNDLPEYDYAPFYSADCQPNVGAYDPNDKRANPEGYDAQHFITADDKLEYHIRFQNTGTDTAFTVVIRDTLSPFLDASTVISGASSDAYSFRIYANNILEWTFNNILLPDSNVDEPGSHGFVKFMVSQKPGNPNGTVIHNSAGIYFDFNEPVITNQTFHTIGENFITLDVVETPGQQYTIKAYPNPFSEYTTIQVEGLDAKDLNFVLRDLSGRTVMQQQIQQTGSVTVYRNDLSSGMYIFQLHDGKKQIGTGKLIIR